MPGRAYLTKSRYVAGLQCAKRLWLQVFEPEPWREAAAGSPLAVGQDVGLHAQRLFPGGVAVQAKPWERRHACLHTRELMADASVPAIYEAAFTTKGVHVRADVLERLPGGWWGLREVKASGSAKPEYIDDTAIQAYVIARSGVRLGPIELIHIDTSYERSADGIDWRRFFNRVDITADVRAASRTIFRRLSTQRDILQLQAPPPVEPSSHCKSPVECEFWGRCTAQKPIDWIHYLPHLSQTKRSGLRGLGVESIAAIPEDFPLTPNQTTIRNVIRTGVTFVSPRLGDALRTAGPPSAYLDFETVNPAVPLWPGTRPYQQVPFQWSVHVARSDGALDHHEFLAEGPDDPRLPFIESLLDALRTTDMPIIAYSGFEQRMLGELQEVMPSELAAGIDQLRNRLFDLHAVVRTHVYHPGFNFRTSIKTVAPALAPHITYADLPLIADGQAASAAFQRIIAGAVGPLEDETELRAALLRYCERDTRAMVEVHRALLGLADSGGGSA